MVRLKALEIASAAFSPSDFNSTMVRLKARLATARQDLTCTFQFHYGTIKR